MGRRNRLKLDDGRRPSKACAACGRPFAWRRKWARCWAEVKYCSDRCRTRGGGAAPQ